jgi:uncharacterized membrane protein
MVVALCPINLKQDYMKTQHTRNSNKFASNSNYTLNSRFWKMTFLIAGIYTSIGVVPGIFNPEQGLLDFTGHIIEDWNTLYFFRSLWITVFVFGIGFLTVALNPAKHVGIVIMGLLGKLFFASNVLFQYSNEKLSHMAMTAATIDLLFVLLFGIFIFKYYSND